MRHKNQLKKFKRVVILDTVIFYPEHRALLNSLAEEVVEFPSSLPEQLEKQYEESPELFLNKKCYTQIAAEDVPLQLLMNRVEGADVIISCWTNIPDEILRLNPQLKLILFWTHEKEHRVNMKLAKELNITVTNIPDYGTDAVAEVVFAGLWELLLRNHAATESVGHETETMHAVMNAIFRHFRMLPENEKYTRAGKFTHHFHKLGLVKFDFTQKNIDELIPEKLLEHKRVGLLNLTHTGALVRTMTAFSVVPEGMSLVDSNLASSYKFFAENELVIFDGLAISEVEQKKMKLLFPQNFFIDIRNLPTSDYTLIGKTFGVVGLGRIGLRVASLAKSLGFNVIYFSKTRHQAAEKELGIEFVELNTLSKTSDVISIHLPAHKAENLLNKAFVNGIKTGSILINTADGNAVDQITLSSRMSKNEIVAYLDVYPGLPRKDILGLEMKDKADWKLHKELPNNVFAYRAGWKTQESIRVKTYKLLGEMVNFLNGREDIEAEAQEE